MILERTVTTVSFGRTSAVSCSKSIRASGGMVPARESRRRSRSFRGPPSDSVHSIVPLCHMSRLPARGDRSLRRWLAVPARAIHRGHWRRRRAREDNGVSHRLRSPRLATRRTGSVEDVWPWLEQRAEESYAGTSTPRGHWELPLYVTGRSSSPRRRDREPAVCLRQSLAASITSRPPCADRTQRRPAPPASPRRHPTWMPQDPLLSTTRPAAWCPPRREPCQLRRFKLCLGMLSTG